jgi:hypothetical protein
MIATRFLHAQLIAPQTTPLGLAIFRIVYAVVLTAEVAQLFYFRALVFDRVPYLAPSEISVELALVCWLVSLTCLGFGLFTQQAVIVNYLMTVLTFGTFQRDEYHCDHIYIVVNLLLVVTPVSTCLSLDRWLENRRRRLRGSSIEPSATVSAFYYHAIVFLGIAVVYFDSFLWKLDQDLWRSGLGVWLPMSLPHNTWLSPELLTRILNRESFVWWASFITLALEGSFIFLMWVPRARAILFIVGTSLHLGVLIAFPIPLFALTMIALYLLLLPWDKIESRLGNRQSVERPQTNVDVVESSPWRLRAIVAATAVCLVLQVPFLIDIPMVKRVVGSADGPIESVGVLATVKHYAHGLAGVCSHGVFLDAHFEGYDHIVAVVYVHPDGEEEWLPMTTPSGQAGSYASGRQWARWAFRGCSPYMDCQLVAQGVRDFTAFWAIKHGRDLNDATFRILVKSYGPKHGWHRNHLIDQTRKPWQLAGLARWQHRQYQCQIGNIETALTAGADGQTYALQPAVHVDWTPAFRVAAEPVPSRF